MLRFIELQLPDGPGGPAADPPQDGASDSPAVAEACDTALDLARRAAGLRAPGARACVLCDALTQLSRAWSELHKPGARGAAALPELLQALRGLLALQDAE